MSRKRPGWRAAERTYRHLSAVLARKAREEVRQAREDRVATVCPDGDRCQDPGCVAARAAYRRGADWRGAVAAMEQTVRDATVHNANRPVSGRVAREGAMAGNDLGSGTGPAMYVSMNELVVMVGGSGSGKSTVRKDRFGAVPVVDCDEIKMEHPEYDAKNPAAVHEWSSEQATRRLMSYVSRGESVVYDSTGSNVEKLAMFANIARSAGMKVTAVFVTCAVETAVTRDAKRARTVGASVVREAHARVAMAVPVLRAMVDRFEVVNTD